MKNLKSHTYVLLLKCFNFPNHCLISCYKKMGRFILCYFLRSPLPPPTSAVSSFRSVAFTGSCPVIISEGALRVRHRDRGRARHPSLAWLPTLSAFFLISPLVGSHQRDFEHGCPWTVFIFSPGLQILSCHCQAGLEVLGM